MECKVKAVLFPGKWQIIGYLPNPSKVSRSPYIETPCQKLNVGVKTLLCDNSSCTKALLWGGAKGMTKRKMERFYRKMIGFVFKATI